MRLDDRFSSLAAPFYLAATSEKHLCLPRISGTLAAEKVDGHVLQVLVAPLAPAVAASLLIGACARLQDQVLVVSSQR